MKDFAEAANTPETPLVSRGVIEDANGTLWVTPEWLAQAMGKARQRPYRWLKTGKYNLTSEDRLKIDGKRGTMIKASSLPYDALQQLRKDAFRNLEEPKPEDDVFTLSPPNSQGDLFPPTELEKRCDLLGFSRKERDRVFALLDGFGQTNNHNFAALGFTAKLPFETSVAKSLGLSRDRFKHLKADFNRSDGDLRVLIPKRRGPAPGTGEVLDNDAKTHIRRLMLEGKDGKQTESWLKKYYEQKQAALPGHPYHTPSYAAIMRQRCTFDALDQAARQGPDAQKTAAGCISRHYEDEFAGDAWCTDEWELDGCFYDEENHGRLINYGTHAPKAYLLSFVDERTTCILDWAVTIRLEEAVLDVAERILLKFWPPFRLVSDRAGRFRRLAGKHTTVASSGELVEILSGPLGKLGVRPRGSEEKNPRANRVERLHRIDANLARRDFGPSYRGSNVRERKLTGIDETVRRHLEEHCRRGTLPPQLLSIQRVMEGIVPKWVEEINLAPTKAKGCHGLTRLAAFRQFQPPAEEIEKRKLNPDLIEAAFAEECERKIDRGVIRWPDGKEYFDSQLLLISGERRTVTRSRHNHEQIRVLPSVKGEEPIIVNRRVEVGVYEPEKLATAIGSQKRARKLASQTLPKTDFPEISGVEYIMLKGLRKLPMLSEPIEEKPESSPLPSLYDIGPCTAEEL